MLTDIFRPWKTIAALRERVSYLEGRLDEVTERAEDAEGRAFDRAARCYQYQLERARETEKAALAHVMQQAAMSPIPPFVIQTMKDLPDAD